MMEKIHENTNFIFLCNMEVLFETVTTCFSHCLNTSVLGSIIGGGKGFVSLQKLEIIVIAPLITSKSNL